MSSPDLPTISPGLPVEIGRIDKELGKLWEESDDSKTRASLINLAIYTESAGAVAEDTNLIAQIASEHACRAILILANPSAAESKAQAWISAHCHNVGKGGRQICSEQITFQLDGDICAALPNVVFSHLDSDLPLCFWWQGAFHAPVDENLWSWVDRLIYDSQIWTDPAAQFSLVREIGCLTRRRTVLCDLNWTRLLSARFALANLFDHTLALSRLRGIQSIEITHAPKARTTALLLLGWLAAQLGWTLESVLGSHGFRSPSQGEIAFSLTEAEGACVSLVRFVTSDAIISLSRAKDAEFFHGEISIDGADPITQILPAGRDRIQDHLVVELGRGGIHPLYTKALEVISPLFANA